MSDALKYRDDSVFNPNLRGTTLKRYMRSGFTLVELMVVIGILGLLVGILAVAVIPRLTEAKSKLEIKQVGDLMAGFQTLQSDDAKKKRLRDKKVSDTKGEKFYEAAFKKKLLDDSLLGKIVSLNTKEDAKADKEWIDAADGVMPPNSCSYTAPKASDLLAVMGAKGADRTVFLTFNKRNWNNYEDDGVIVQWSDAETAEYITKDIATADLNLDGETWASSPEELIGQKKPFNRTFE
jgi:prepilin-type N-terminal cleavage/methylation domain-containing protein